MSGKLVRLLDVQAVSLANVVDWTIERWDGIPAFDPGAVVQSVYKTDTTDAACVGVVTLDPTLDVSGLTTTWHRKVQTLLG